MAQQESAVRSFGSDLRLTFNCPQCTHAGWVLLRQLPKGMKCQACNCCFWIDQRGHLQTERDAPKVKFRCQRCTTLNTVLVEFAGRGTACSGCGEHYFQAPDGAFCTREHIDKARREAAAETQRHKARENAWNKRFELFGGWIRLSGTTAIVLTTLVAGALIAGVFRPGKPPGLFASAEQFTAACVAQRHEAAREFIAAEDEAEFARWAQLFHRPPRAEMSETAAEPRSVRAEAYEQNTSWAVLRLTIDAPPRGRSMQTQHWKFDGERWRFDPTATLAALASVREN